MVEVVVVHSDSRLIGSFEAMFNFLQINFCPLARVNHKVNSVEKYHWVLNKTQSISGKYCGSHYVFILNAKTSQYA